MADNSQEGNMIKKFFLQLQKILNTRCSAGQFIFIILVVIVILILKPQAMIPRLVHAFGALGQHRLGDPTRLMHDIQRSKPQEVKVASNRAPQVPPPSSIKIPLSELMKVSSVLDLEKLVVSEKFMCPPGFYYEYRNNDNVFYFKKSANNKNEALELFNQFINNSFSEAKSFEFTEKDKFYEFQGKGTGAKLACSNGYYYPDSYLETVYRRAALHPMGEKFYSSRTRGENHFLSRNSGYYNYRYRIHKSAYYQKCLDNRCPDDFEAPWVHERRYYFRTDTADCVLEKLKTRGIPVKDYGIARESLDQLLDEDTLIKFFFTEKDPERPNPLITKTIDKYLENGTLAPDELRNVNKIILSRFYVSGLLSLQTPWGNESFEDLGYFKLKPMTKENVKNFVEYLWSISGDQYNKNVISSEIEEDSEISGTH